MGKASARRRWILATVVLILLGGAAVGWWFWSRSLPRPGSPLYEQYAECFERGTVALDVDYPIPIESSLSEAIKLIPQEPAAWANRGLFYLRGSQRELAASDLNKAHTLAPNNADIEVLLGLLYQDVVKLPEAIEHVRAAVKIAPNDPAILYLLGFLLKQKYGENDTTTDEEYGRLMDRILEIQPDNLEALMQRIRVAIHQTDKKTFGLLYQRLVELSAKWSEPSDKELPESPRKLLQKLHEFVDGPWRQEDISSRLTLLNNVLATEPAMRRARKSINYLMEERGRPIQKFIRLAPLRTLPSEPDRSLTYSSVDASDAKSPPGIRGIHWDIALPIWLNADVPVALFVANASDIRRADSAGPALPFPSGPKKIAPSANGVLPIDWNNDRRTDLLLAGAGGLRFMQQEADGSFKDVTDKTKLPDEVLKGDYFGAWAADIEMDGDLDVILARRQGPPLLLRNNRDGTFLSKAIFPDVEGLRVLAWADLDNDGAPDATLLDQAGKLHVFLNQRGGYFKRRTVPDLPDLVLGLTFGDVNADGVFDLVVLLRNGEVLRLSDRDKGQGWDVAKIAQVDLPELFPKDAVPGSCRLFLADLDNNGRGDLLVSTPAGNAFFLADTKGFQSLPLLVKETVFGVVDSNEDGLLDLAVLGQDGPAWLRGKGTKGYRWQLVRPRAFNGPATGDDRINSFGVGGEVEIRAGSMVEKRPITGPMVHFGLGERKRAEVISLTWPNGAHQAIFDLVPDKFIVPDKVIVAEQNLKGSCPFLFTWDGQRMVFVSDFLWSTPLGMYINGQDQGGFAQTTDWVRIRGNQLQPRDGFLDLRVQANLWETHYIDQLALQVVDHPPGTEMYIDERFFLTPTKPQIYLTGPAQPIVRALDHKGKDATDEVRSIDGVYLDRAGRGKFQGITHDHWVEIYLGEEAQCKGPVYLIANGFIHPTDSSINYAITKGAHDQPRGLTLEIPDGKGGWKVGRDALGFPAGKNKNVLIRLDGIEGPGVVSRHIRLRTNMEIYWDALFWARGLDASQCQVRTLQPEEAELRFRGILAMTQANRSSPELPHYDQVIDRRQHWRDLTGWYTRYGDVRELLEKPDDRYVIMNAGDEIALRYKVPPPPKEGYRRDYVWISDGWVKDGDFNTRFGKTVLPLPYHGMASYDKMPASLEDDPVYRRFPRDWETYHTRYVTPSVYERGLRPMPRGNE